MSHTMLYKKNAGEVVARRKDFFDGKMRDRILMTTPIVPLTPEQLRAEGVEVAAPAPGRVVDAPPNVEDIYVKWEHTLRARADFEDDSLALANLFRDHGNAIGVACMGRPVRYMTLRNGTASSGADGGQIDLDDLDALRFDPDSDMARTIRELAAVFNERRGDRFALNPYIVNDGFMMMNLIQGYDKTICDLSMDPEAAGAALDRLTDVAIALQELEYELIGPLWGGWTNKQAVWHQDKVVTLNLDDFLFCGEEFYHRYGAPYHQRIIDRFGRGLIHYHTPAPVLLEAVLSLKNVVAIQISPDPNLPRPIEQIHELRRLCGDLPILDILVRRDEFETMLRGGRLPGGVEYCLLGATDVDDVNRLAEMARNYVSPC